VNDTYWWSDSTNDPRPAFTWADQMELQRLARDRARCVHNQMVDLGCWSCSDELGVLPWLP
jgi:hypothetical protein